MNFDSGALHKLHTALRELDDLAGKPSLDEIVELSDNRIGRSTVGDMRSGKRRPRKQSMDVFVETCLTRARALDRPIPAELADPTFWDELWEASRGARTRSGIRVRDVTAAAVGVHRAIRGEELGLLPDVASDPLYVRRCFDGELRRRVGVGGIVVLKGRSTSGKTRSLWEAVRAKLPDWEFADCRDRAEVGRIDSGSDVVVWLDDLRVTQTPGALAASLRPLLERRRVLVAATTWPPPTGERHELDELVDIGAAVITVDEEWTESELKAAANLAERDSRLAIALRHTNFGPAQVLGGTPWLLRLWEDAHDRPLGAVITAAVDLARLGADVVSDEVLSSAATAYLRPNARWRPTWYTDALTEAIELIRGAVSALVPQPDATLTTVVGYRLSDALRDYGDQRRHWVPVPEATWRALTRTGTRSEALTMARRARKRLLFSVADDLEAHAADLPEIPPERAVSFEIVAVDTESRPPRQMRGPIVLSLEAPERTEADRLYKAKDLDGLRALARPSNDSYVRARLARLLADLGLEDELLRLAVISNRAARTVAELFANQGRIDDLLRHIVCGNGFAKRALADWSITGLTDEDRARILDRGLIPNGTPA